MILHISCKCKWSRSLATDTRSQGGHICIDINDTAPWASPTLK